ncbi:MAG TPA: thiamine pyrophosphate-dependent enzyme [Streptosporangiaceae bacterium]
MSGAGEVVSALAAAGTRLVFGVPGGGPNLDVVGVAAGAGLRFVLTHGETAAVIMAATCADLTGAPGAVVVTRGPGLASAVNGVAHAALDRLPVVVISDTVAAADADRISHQRIDQAALGAAVAKAAVTVGGQDPAAAARVVRTALAAPPGPVIANMDASSNTSTASPTSTTGPTSNSTGNGGPGGGPGEPAPAIAAPGGPRQAEAAGKLGAAVRAARRPLLLLGTGAIPYTAAIRGALAGRGIPALHTYRARGVLPDDGPDAAGLVTGGTMEWPLLAAADLIVGLGVHEAEMIPTAWDYAARTILVTGPGQHSGLGPSQDGGYRGYFTGASALTMPLSQAAAVLGTALADGPRHGWPPGVGRAARRDATRRLMAAASAAPGLLAPQAIAAAVRAGTPPGTVATVDAGAHMLAVMPLWEVAEPRRLLISSGLATMGYALPAAIAAALCGPARGGPARGGPARGETGQPVVAFTGDGGLGMTLAEIETAVRLALRIVVVVFNDSALSLIKIKQRPAGQGGAGAVSYRPVSYAAAAAAMGAAGVTVSTEPELARALTAALRRAGPTVIDAQTDPAGYPAVIDLSRGQAGRTAVPGLARDASNQLPAAAGSASAKERVQ